MVARSPSPGDHPFRQAFDLAPIAMVHVDAEGRCRVANRAMAALLGMALEDLPGRQLTDLAHPDDRPQLAAAVRAMASGATPWYRSEDRWCHAGGTVVTVSTTAAPIAVGGDGAGCLLFHLVDVTGQRDLEVQLRALADQDPLTGLRNRRSFEAALHAQAGLVARYGVEASVLALDVDHFKEINDLYGHQAGDDLIVQVAEVLRGRLRASDVVARIGGDEFAVILPDAGPAAAEQVAGKLVTAVRATCRTGRDRAVTTSVGVASFDGSLPGSTLLARADAAMYEAKQRGRDRFAVYRAEQAAASPGSRLAMVERLERALRDDHFALDAQPVVDLASGATAGYELLLRLQDGAVSLPPSAFLGVAEQAGLLERIDRFVVGAALALLGAPDADPALSLSVNVSPQTLASEETLTLLEAGVAAAPGIARRLTLEVPERALPASLAVLRPVAAELRRMGVHLAVDDFTAGLATFTELEDLAFDAVKIDGRVVRRCAASASARLVVRALVEVAHGLGTQVVAEWVEDAETASYLTDLAVDLGQGFHLGRAFPSHHLARVAGPTPAPAAR